MPFGGESAESYYDEGLTALMRGDADQAILSLTKAVQLDSSFVAAYHQLGKAYARVGQIQRAVDIFGQVITRKPSFVQARLDLAGALLQLGRNDLARNQFQHVLAQQATNGRAHLGMAQLAFAEGQWDSAVALAQAARAYGGSNFSVLYLLGRAAKLAGNHLLSEESLREAESLIGKSVEMSPDMPEGYFLRGEVSFVREQFHNALDQYQAAETRIQAGRHYSAFGENFSRIDILVKKGICLQRLGNIDMARDIGKQILQLAPEHKLGQALAKL